MKKLSTATILGALCGFAGPLIMACENNNYWWLLMWLFFIPACSIIIWNGLKK